MSGLIRKYSTFLIIVLSLVLGFVLPQVGLLWKPYLALLLMLLMFSVTLSIEPNEITRSIRNYYVIAMGLFTVFVLTPSLSLIAKVFFSPIVYAGTVLAFSCPSAIATAFWTKIFKGDVATAIIISAITNLLSIVTIPVTMLVVAGAVVNVDIVSMMVNLGEIVLIPMALSFLLRKFVPVDWNKLSSYGSKIEIGILILLIWGSVAPGVEYTLNNMEEFVLLNVFMFGALASALVLTHFLTKRFGYRKARSIEIATTVKNAALSLVVGLTAFGPEILPPLIANLVAQNLLLIPAKAFTKE